MTARAAVILAAGQGTRMKSPIPKVLHKVGGRTLLDRVIDTVLETGCERVVVVIGTHSPAVRQLVEARLGAGAAAVQDPPLGTGHAVLAAGPALSDFEGDVLVVNGDCPLLAPEDLDPLFSLRAQGADLALLGFEPADPLLYGRILSGPEGEVRRIVEARDASPAELMVRTCYAGMLCADRARLFDWLSQVTNANAKGEYYLTDVVSISAAEGRKVRAHYAPETAVMGADTPAQLAQAEAVFQQRRRTHFLSEGVVMPAPETVHFSWDTRIEAGVQVEPYVVFAPGVSIETGAVIRAFSHLEGARVGPDALIGPYARLRPGADIGEEVHIGNFVEVKKVRLDKGAKANHLAYLGDGTVGAGANIGAGTIFCNYDGFDKYETHVGPGAFIGSNTAIVAPRSIGAGAMTGSGSVIVRDVPDDALALARGEQSHKAGWAAAFRARKTAEKAARKAKGGS
ncbi:bifunctional UDP-N-acetylglucosamine diphosphorylase/glucosamine-1-phosphate N-acetyltransferase GlmU [Phenylobacterium sp.]|uniref:bifunctional UDP-N-acetylglucosamine diphosphorylase/glucosamine-1-phosphate N-acetyltransferase GlmU n=1 Tax=Phenylobacterium sp. TaxID=1871053 RepID=UPI0025CCEB04|nr:bifunctional UDP-N-acetylglucosamine diphosphorylase/glucosamine-1-phosphate N-acetyltransferase GlmU [Phenylobacterium sp.]MCA6287073.1 bifunctional UDP-N-acetylglucosamine diphosphorylase/glucosamine-1-phosphate N-acetyltransferase GlmU [Phenylobacterium sp.]MCA6289629.1 bifunctional UDP-N-acetylglucosamine diphosphorylase/glucosamine-1-phosphate N-acetyltransferase GlmU [Phenylobacterium sp.]MCA6310635.1 bifunctional UDP-N-acetylglucosamine diphosphorylase/glucosamine-1-phosphate N-acetylt